MDDEIDDYQNILDTRLQQAIYEGDVVTAQKFISCGANINSDGGEALYMAATYDYAKMVNILLNHGADIDILDYNLLTVVIELGNTDIVSLYIDKNILTSNWSDAMLFAVEKNKYNIVKLFLDNGVDVNVYDSKALSIAVNNNNMEIVSLLIDYGINIHQCGNNVHGIAIQNNYNDILSLLQDTTIEHPIKQEPIDNDLTVMSQSVIGL